MFGTEQAVLEGAAGSAVPHCGGVLASLGPGLGPGRQVNGHGHSFSLQEECEENPTGKTGILSGLRKTTLTQRNLLLFSLILAKNLGTWLYSYCFCAQTLIMCTLEAPVAH